MKQKILQLTLRVFFSLIFCGILLMIFSITSPAQNNRWSFVGRSADGIDFYLDVTSVEKTKNIIRTWEKSIFPDGSYQINLSAWQCDRRTSSLITSRVYTPAGSLISIKNGNSWMEVTPDSIAEAFYKRVCNPSEIAGNSEEIVQMQEVRIISDQANIRQVPAMNAPVVKKVKKGTKLKLASSLTEGGWYEVYIGDKTAWIHGNTVEFITPISSGPSGKKKTKLPESIFDLPSSDN